jgi:hypothetical protein
MMIEQTLDKLRALRLSGMVEAYRQQTQNPDIASISFEERLGLLVDQHWTWRENKALARRRHGWMAASANCCRRWHG